MRSSHLALLPGALTVYLGYSSGGYFPPAIGTACVVLAIALVLRLTLAERPLEGFGGPAALAAGALALLAVWTIASSAWSDAPGRALLDFDRVLLYLLLFAFVASFPRSPESTRHLFLGLGAGGTVVCLGALLTRVLPESFAVDLPVLPQRLSYPISYWNGLGLLAVLTIVAAVHFTCSEKEHPAIRIGAAALVPLLATTLYFTFSRASIAVVVAALLAYMLLARPRGLAAGALAVLPVSLIALKLAYDADLLASTDPTTAGAADQGRDLALVLLACSLGAAGIRLLLIRTGFDSRLERVEIRRETRRLATGVAVGVLLLGAVGSWVAFDLGDRIDRQYERFKEGDSLGRDSDARDRLTDVGNNGRIDHWEEALDSWHREKLKGQGAGTYELTWARYRPVEFTVLDGHSLYLETMSELGLAGLVLLLLALGTILVGLVLRVRGPDRPLWAALLVATATWVVFAAQDWVWELPAVTLWPVVLGAAALARTAGSSGGLPRLARVVGALMVLALAVTPGLAGISHARLQEGVSAFKRGDCNRAIDNALSSTSAISSRPEPYAILAFCDVRLGKVDLAERMMRDAVDRDPENWTYRYGLALVLGAAGKDPRPEMAKARELNPLDGLLIRTERSFDTNDPQKWRRRALEARLPIG